jgi:hypothetical protein
MNPGDKLSVHMFDAKASGGGSAFEAVVSDATTGQTSYMRASAANGFMNTDPSSCNGTPFNFEPEYSTASANNITPWTALQVNISTQFEIGHFEPCSNVTGPVANPLAPGVTDTYWKHCAGAYETTTASDGGKSPEISDAFCYPQGDTHGGLAPPNVVTGCQDNVEQNGDLDFDGTPYWADWPTSTTPNTFPSTFLQQAPTTVGGANYPPFQFQTDAALSESTCAGRPGLVARFRPRTRRARSTRTGPVRRRAHGSSATWPMATPSGRTPSTALTSSPQSVTRNSKAASSPTAVNSRRPE